MKEGDIVIAKSMYEKADYSMPALITYVSMHSVTVEYYHPRHDKLMYGASSKRELIVLEPWR